MTRLVLDFHDFTAKSNKQQLPFRTHEPRHIYFGIFIFPQLFIISTVATKLVNVSAFYKVGH
jgi:hypothetical protein